MDPVVLPRSDFDRLAKFAGTAYVLLEQLEIVAGLLEHDHPARLQAWKAIEASRRVAGQSVPNVGNVED